MAAFRALVKRAPVISDTSKGPIVNLVSWICMTTMCLAVATVLISKLVVLRKLRWNELIITSASIFAIAYIASVNIQVGHGLGSPLSSLSDAQFVSFQKAGYASHILYILALFFGKASTLSLLGALPPDSNYKQPMLVVAVVTGLWAVSSILGSAFQCAMPKPWLYASGRCFDQTSFWYAVAAVDIITDLAFVALPVVLVYSLQLPKQKKIAVCFAFSFRIFAVGCTVFRILELPKLFRRGTDVTFGSWVPTLATILEVFFGVFGACVPHLRPFMESIQAGYLSGVIEDSEGRVGYGNESFLPGKLGPTKGSVGTVRSQNAVSVEELDASFDLPQLADREDQQGTGNVLHTQTGVSDPGGGDQEKASGGLGQSTTSSGYHCTGDVGSRAMVINTTKEWCVSYHDI